MAAPNDQTTQLPSDSAAKKAFGLWNDAAGYYDAPRSTQNLTLLASAGRAGVTTSAVQTNVNARGVCLAMHVTAAGTGTLQLWIQNLTPDGVEGITIALVTGINATGWWMVTAYPGIASTSSPVVSTSAALARSWLGSVVPSDGSTWTYTLEAMTLL